jgi:hypothetical protein
MSPMLQQFAVTDPEFSHHLAALGHLDTVAVEIQRESLLLLHIT